MIMADDNWYKENPGEFCIRILPWIEGNVWKYK